MSKEWVGTKGLIFAVVCGNMTALASGGEHDVPRFSTAISPSELREFGWGRSAGKDPEGCIVYHARPFSRSSDTPRVPTQKLTSDEHAAVVSSQVALVPDQQRDREQDRDGDENAELLGLGLKHHPVSSPSKGVATAMAAFSLRSPRAAQTPSLERVGNLKRGLEELLGNEQALANVVGNDAAYKRLCALVAEASGNKAQGNQETVVTRRPRSSSLKGPRPTSGTLQRVSSVPVPSASCSVDPFHKGGDGVGEEVCVQS